MVMGLSEWRLHGVQMAGSTSSPACRHRVLLPSSARAIVVPRFIPCGARYPTAAVPELRG